jgi:predicted ester cyclase
MNPSPKRFFMLTILVLAGTALSNAQSQQNAGGTMSENAAHVAVIHRFYEECLNQGRVDELSELFTPGVVGHSGSGKQTGLAEFERNVHHVRSMFPNGRFTVDDVVASGDEAAARWTMTATHTAPIAGVAPTGKPIVNHAVVFYRFENDKIAELWVQLDQIGVLQQIGVQIPGMPTAPAPANQQAVGK